MSLMKYKLKNTKAIILAGGYGTRLYPISRIFSKQLFPIYDKPMIFYPLKLLSNLKIKEICIISDSKNIKNIKKIISFYKKKDQKITFKIQDKPNGLPEAFLISKKFIGNDNVILLLGDNIFFNMLYSQIKKAFINLKKEYSTIFGYKVKNPEEFGVAKLNKKSQIIDILEKPKKKISNIAVVGLYFFTNNVIKYSKILKPSKRNELEITDLIKLYLNEKKLKIEILKKKTKWFDAGTFDSILKISNFVKNKKI